MSKFYQRAANRWDKTCKDCRKALDREQYQRKKKTKVEKSFPITTAPKPDSTVKTNLKRDRKSPTQTKKTRQAGSEGIIEPRYNETKELVNAIDFNDFEKEQDRPLTEIEKYEMVQNFNEFVSILIDAYEEREGCHVYIE